MYTFLVMCTHFTIECIAEPFSKLNSTKGGYKANGVVYYMEPLHYKTHIYEGMFYMWGCVFVLRQAMECLTVFIGG